MKLIGCLLLLSGWLIVIAALIMLSAFTQRVAFIAAGVGVEILGLALLTQSYTSMQRGAK